MNSRMKEIRIDSGLSQAKFGKKLFISQDHVSSMENGRRSLTERTINDICTTFSVNEEWLRYGTGEKYIDPTIDMDVPDHLKDMIRKFSKLDSKSQEKLLKILDVFLNESENNKIDED